MQTWWQLSVLFSHCPCMWMSRTTNETDKHYFPHHSTLEGTDREDVFFSVRPFVSSEWSFGFSSPPQRPKTPDFEGFLYLGSKLLQKMLNIKSCLGLINYCFGYHYSYTIMVYGLAFHLWSLRFDILQQRCSLYSFYSSLIVKQAIYSLCKSHSNSFLNPTSTKQWR